VHLQWWMPELKVKSPANDRETLIAYRSLKKQCGLEDSLPTVTLLKAERQRAGIPGGMYDENSASKHGRTSRSRSRVVG
jgi:hypothetical protein